MHTSKRSASKKGLCEPLNESLFQEIRHPSLCLRQATRFPSSPHPNVPLHLSITAPLLLVGGLLNLQSHCFDQRLQIAFGLFCGWRKEQEKSDA
jgi:hypothetical protein